VVPRTVSQGKGESLGLVGSAIQAKERNPIFWISLFACWMVSTELRVMY
jgi:hypothetical protein